MTEREGEADDHERLLADQQRYYRERAAEYDDWFFFIYGSGVRATA